MDLCDFFFVECFEKVRRKTLSTNNFTYDFNRENAISLQKIEIFFSVVNNKCVVFVNLVYKKLMRE